MPIKFFEEIEDGEIISRVWKIIQAEVADKTWYFQTKLDISRQNLIFPDKTWYFQTKLDISRQNLIFPDKTWYF